MSMDALRRLHNSLGHAANHAQNLKDNCSNVRHDVCRNVALAVSFRCRRLRQRSSRARIPLATVNSPENGIISPSDKVLHTAESNGSTTDTAAKPGKVSGSIWGPHGARAATSDAADAATQQDVP